jgi:hypothetical protein
MDLGDELNDVLLAGHDREGGDDTAQNRGGLGVADGVVADVARAFRDELAYATGIDIDSSPLCRHAGQAGKFVEVRSQYGNLIVREVIERGHVVPSYLEALA